MKKNAVVIDLNHLRSINDPWDDLRWKAFDAPLLFALEETSSQII